MTSEQRVGKRAEQKRRWDRENKYDHCQCGARKMTKAAACWECEMVNRYSGTLPTRRRIAEMWATGTLLREMAAELGWSVGHLQNEISRMRKAGWDLPYRYKAWERRAA